MSPTGASRASDADQPSRVVLITRSGCHLCDEAREVVRRVVTHASIGWTEQDVDADSELRARYGEYVPVVLVDGAQHGFWRIDETRLRDALAVATS
ncbi:MAG: glutaredoxin family protein [Angustibacter sp.]